MTHSPLSSRIAVLAAIAFLTAVPAVFAPSRADAGCTVVYSQDFASVMQTTFHQSFPTRQPAPANITTQAQCESALRSTDTWRNDFRFRQTRCECTDSPSGGGGGGFSMPSAPYGSHAFGQQLALGIVQQGLESLLAPPKGPSPEEIARQQAAEAEARRIADEEARRKAEEEARRQAIEKARRLAIAGGMKNPDGQALVTASVSGPTSGWKGLDADDMASPSAASAIVPGAGGNAGSTTFDRLRCAQAFSSAAREYASMVGPGAAEKARFFAQQSENALAGRPLDAECPALASLPEVPMPTGIEIVHLGEGTREELIQKATVDLAALNTVHAKKQELTERKAALEAKKKEIEEKAAKPPEPPPADAPAPTAAPADTDTDKLKAEAEALLRESQAELAEIEKSEKSLADEETRLSDNLKRYETKARALEAAAGGAPPPK
ncbi:MAG TPA: hypothetical protein VGK27_01370 [Candidatus Deferrimicrobiaceae bacterium]|jgi:hypothetical protein